MAKTTKKIYTEYARSANDTGGADGGGADYGADGADYGADSKGYGGNGYETPPRRRGRGFAAAILVILLAAASVLVYRFRDEIIEYGDKLLGGNTSGGEALTSDADAPYRIESGSVRAAAATENYLAVATVSGVQMFGSDGELITRSFFDLSEPAVAAFDDGAVFYSVGGQTLTVITVDGSVNTLDCGNRILAVSAGKNGRIAAVTEESGYKALITVYDEKLTPIFRQHSATLNITSARLSPDGSSLASAGINAEGSAITTYSVGREEPLGSYLLEGQVVFDLAYISDDAVCAVSPDSLVIIDAKSGKLKGEFDFDGRELSAYSLGGNGFAALILSGYNSGTAEQLITVGADGKQKSGELTLSRSAAALDANGAEVILLSGGTLTLYDSLLRQKAEISGVLDIESVSLIGKGKCLALYAHTAETIKF